MARIVIKKHHALPLETAKQRAEELFEQYRQRFGATRTWHGNTLVLSGRGFDAQAVLTESELDIEVNLGLKASLAKPLIQSGLEAELRKRFGDD